MPLVHVGDCSIPDSLDCCHSSPPAKRQTNVESLKTAHFGSSKISVEYMLTSAKCAAGCYQSLVLLLYKSRCKLACPVPVCVSCISMLQTGLPSTRLCKLYILSADDAIAA